MYKNKVFVNGVFDVLHPGHIKLIKSAQKYGRYIIIGINSDKSVKKLKGKKRPIFNQNARKKILETLSFVEKVYIFNENTPANLIKKIKPDIIIKGDHYDIDEVRKKDKISKNIIIKTIKLDKKYSTTKIINKILKSYEKNSNNR